MPKTKKKDDVVTNVVDGLIKLYNAKIKPVEDLYLYSFFGVSPLKDADIRAKPSVLFLGQYSTGKTSFIRYLLEGDYPGMNIGPEPTTDRFVAVMHNKEELVIPGNALCARSDMPFCSFDRFGNDFLTKFQASMFPSPLLEELTFIDTPGVLSGEKQRIGRSYDFTTIVEMFASRADLIILCFDAHKLDISDEFKRTIEVLRGNEDKTRVVLNKCDCVTQQELMRVYGALMWSLGKVMKTPEVMRVYIGSFWDKPYKNDQLAALFDAEREDLIDDLHNVPRSATVRKINELVKRARAVRVHAYIISEIHEAMPSVFGKEKKKNEIISSLNSFFNRVKAKYNLSVGDFPNIERYTEFLSNVDFERFPKLNQKLLKVMDECISVDIPGLLKMFPMEQIAAAETNPFETANNFERACVILGISDEKIIAYTATFDALEKTENNKVSGARCRDVLMESKLPKDLLSQIWRIADRGSQGSLSRDQFIVAMGLVEVALSGKTLPTNLPPV